MVEGFRIKPRLPVLAGSASISGLASGPEWALDLRTVESLIGTMPGLLKDNKDPLLVLVRFVRHRGYL
jgi:hypothetical protein